MHNNWSGRCSQHVSALSSINSVYKMDFHSFPRAQTHIHIHTRQLCPSSCSAFWASCGFWITRPPLFPEKSMATIDDSMSVNWSGVLRSTCICVFFFFSSLCVSIHCFQVADCSLAVCLYWDHVTSAASPICCCDVELKKLIHETEDRSLRDPGGLCKISSNFLPDLSLLISTELICRMYHFDVVRWSLAPLFE